MNNEELLNIRHSTAHLLAAAIEQFAPDTKRAIGPATDNGFYYDFEFKDPINENDFPQIEEKMTEILKTWDNFEREEVSAEEAKKRFANEPYKLELIEEFSKEGQTLTIYKSGEYEDLCRGGHTDNPKQEIGAFKLLSLAGAYWRGSEKNKMLTRIYGTAFPTQEELNNYLKQQEEAKKRDHKKLGRELELFFFTETAPGMTYWLPKGLEVYNTLYNFTREIYKKYNYEEVATPQLNKKELYETSGHWQHYRQDMFISPMSYLTGDSSDILEGSEVFGIKPMNCPNAMLIFRLKTRSYHNLPWRIAETSLLHRFELSGTLNGLFRTRQFRQDDAHIFLTADQLKSEFTLLMQMIAEMYKPFSLTYKLRFGTRPEQFMGEKNDWDNAEKMLQQVLDESGEEYFTAPGEGAFYGPKIDILMLDSLQREWQTGTIQLDFQQPKNFNLKYTQSDGSEVTPIVIHRAIYGSFERFLGILIEHYAGDLPLWLAPIQIILLPIANRHQPYAQKIQMLYQSAGIRAEINERQDRLPAKIREATLQKIPFMGIIGDDEIAEKAISIRRRTGEDLGKIEISKFLAQLRDKIDKKT